MRSRRAGARAFFWSAGLHRGQVDWARRSPPTGDCAGANAKASKPRLNSVFTPPFASVLQAASAAPGLRSGPAVNSTSRNPACTLLDGFLAISFDNLGAGAQLALSIAEASHRTQVPRNYRIGHLPARTGHTKTRSAQNAPESTLPRPQPQQEQKTSTPRRAAPNKPWRTRTSSN